MTTAIQGTAVRLSTWAASRFAEPPSPASLRRQAAAGHIPGAFLHVGRWYVDLAEHERLRAEAAARPAPVRVAGVTLPEDTPERLRSTDVVRLALRLVAQGRGG